MVASEKIIKEKIEECAKLEKEFEALKRRAEESAERVHKAQLCRDHLEKQLADLKRCSVPIKTHQSVMEQLEQAEQKVEK